MPRVAARPRVVLLPGLWFTAASMALLARRLRQQGFEVHTVVYPSVRQDLAGNVDALAAALRDAHWEDAHLVGHSLGGLVIRALRARRPAPGGALAVTLGSPHNGSFVAQRLWRQRFLRPLLGRSVGDLVAGATAALGPAPPGLGCIAGSRPLGVGRLLASGLQCPNDGTVAVREALLDGARDCLVLPVSHTEMLLSRRVSDAVADFLRAGLFSQGRPVGA